MRHAEHTIITKAARVGIRQPSIEEHVTLIVLRPRLCALSPAA
jgi:hypothetical protein